MGINTWASGQLWNQRAEQGEGEGHGYVALAAPGVGGARPPEAHLLGLADDVAGPDPVAL